MMWDILLYICCFYWLMNKAVLVNGLAEQSQMENPNRDIHVEYAVSKRQQVATKGNRYPEILLIGHSLMVMQRLIEID